MKSIFPEFSSLRKVVWGARTRRASLRGSLFSRSLEMKERGSSVRPSSLPVVKDQLLMRKINVAGAREWPAGDFERRSLCLLYCYLLAAEAPSPSLALRGFSPVPR